MLEKSNYKPPKYPKKQLKTIIKCSDPSAIDLLEKMLKIEKENNSELEIVNLVMLRYFPHAAFVKLWLPKEMTESSFIFLSIILISNYKQWVVSFNQWRRDFLVIPNTMKRTELRFREMLREEFS